MKKDNYWSPTPKKWRVLGDSLLAVAGTAVVGGLANFDELKVLLTPHELKVTMIVFLCFGIGGKFLTNFFKEDPPVTNQPDSNKQSGGQV